MFRLFAGVLFAAALLAACSGAAPSGATQPISRPTGTTPTQPSTPAAAATIDMCALMPVGDVQSHSPFSVPLVTAKTNVAPEACVYASGPNAADPVGVQLIATKFASHADALTVHTNHEQDEANLGEPSQQIAGLGDTASAAGEDEVGVQAVLGNLVIDANFKGQWPDLADAQKVASGTALIKLIISRLP